MRKYFLILLIPILITTNCKGGDKNVSVRKNDSSFTENKISDSLFVIKNIDEKSIGKEINEISKNQLLNFYKAALELDFERPIMWDALIPENIDLIKFYQYKTFKLNNQLFNSMYVSIKYEDAKYGGIILLMDENDTTMENKAMLIFENLDAEEKYQRTTHQGKNKELLVEFRKDNNLYRTQSFIIKNNFVVDYFEENKTINNNWGKTEEISTNNLTGTTKEYLMKGNVRNNVKNGHWEERRYSFEYDKNIWMDGYYIDGLKDGEWNLSPNGAVDKVLVYEKGKIIQSFHP